MSGSTPLHPIERELLKSLAEAGSITIEKLTAITHLDIDQVRRGVEWLKFKNMISVEESSSFVVSLTRRGQDAAASGLPERKLVEAVNGGSDTVEKVRQSGLLNKDEVNAAVSAARRNGWIQFSDGGRISVSGAESHSPEELILKKLLNVSLDLSALREDERRAVELLKKRPDYITLKEAKQARISITQAGKDALQNPDAGRMERKLTTEMITSGRWKEITLGPIDVEAPAPAAYPGRSHPLVNIIDEVKEIFVGLGFEEIDGEMAQTGFWNFDALFIPQDHPAREMQDTFYVSGQRQSIPATKDQLRKVAQVQDSGWGRGWKLAEAERTVLRTHTTPVTLRRLADTKPDVGRFFSVGRVFRNEKPSYKHLVEFNQVEGVATAPGLSLRDLMGLQKEFYAKMGIKKVKFWPTFFPYTEPSLQSMVYNESLQKWVELFGMGIFRPEVTRPLGIRNPVLAWGGGIERIAMLRFGLDDVRELYGNRLSWLRGVPRCQL
ncbi:MAG TPA: phenylalanine--tRNA ligase subunit alpha [Nitrososphaera sp.]